MTEAFPIHEVWSARGESTTKSKTPSRDTARRAQDEKAQSAAAGEECENCGSPMVKKFGRFGEFLACTNYPKCKTTRDLPKPHEGAGEEAHAEAADETCENCGKPLVLKRGRFGQFLACTGYPDCKTTRKTQKGEKLAAPDVVLEEHCPQCSSNLALKQGRYGAFTACANYPKCKYVKQETTGVSCPECGTGEIVEKKSKRGAFYGCSRYPACKLTMRDKPIAQACPKCGARYVVEKTRKDGSRELQCIAEGCEYKEALPDLAAGESDEKASLLTA